VSGEPVSRRTSQDERLHRGPVPIVKNSLKTQETSQRWLAVELGEWENAYTLGKGKEHPIGDIPQKRLRCKGEQRG